MTGPAIAGLYDQARAARWGLSVEQFQTTLDAGIQHAFAGRKPAPQDVDRHIASLHLEDLALACACAAGIEQAWDHFVLEFRPALYRAADAIDPTGGTRDLADALYADLFGLRVRDGARQSLFRYFHGRNSLSTWLRAVLSQRHIDRLRAGRRLDPLPDDDAPPQSAMVSRPAGDAVSDPDRPRFMAAMRVALTAAIAALRPRDRLRLGCYYAQNLTLAEIGRLLREHEGTVSRHLTRTKRAIHDDVSARLRREHGMDDRAVAECFTSVIDDAGSLDLAELICKDSGQDRSR